MKLSTTGDAAYPDNFTGMVRTEIGYINQRKNDRDKIEFTAAGPGETPIEVVALALSGGGIRAASFSLGVVQAINERGAFDRIDYLSTVSGGGYFGTALSATLNKTAGIFEFGASTRPGVATNDSDVKDTESVAHLRNYSNYLIPRGGRDILTGLAIILRGLVANAALVLPFLLWAAALIILNNPTRSSLLQPDFFGLPLTWLPVNNFGITLLFVIATMIYFLGWAVVRSCRPPDKQAEFGFWPSYFGSSFLIAIACSFFAELQPYAIKGMFELTERSATSGTSMLTAFIQHLTAIAAPIAAVVTFFRQQIASLLKSVTSSSNLSTKFLALAGEAAIWIAGAALPLLIWLGFLYLCYWGVRNDPQAAESARSVLAIQGSVQINGPGLKPEGTIDCGQTKPGANPGCGTAPASEAVKRGPDEHAPKWLKATAAWLTGAINKSETLRNSGLFTPGRAIAVLYLLFGVLLFLVSFRLTPNANSLHRLYRDRLSKAFLFNPLKKTGSTRAGAADQGRDFEPLDTMQITELVNPKMHGPYHLINAALNIQSSDYSNRRGRNADFFLFSPAHTGSVATGYCSTEDMQTATKLDLATAMAVSGAAFSSNMGSNSIKALTPTLALLNVRTGYWLKNPQLIANDPGRKTPTASPWFLWKELTGQLHENSEDIYITDGGHIENLGIYELLRRRCRVIVAVDAEADPSMRFPSFVALQRYARIDLGVRISMPWDQIRSQTMGWMGADGSQKDNPPVQSVGPHAAIGRIEYDGGKEGWLLYIKSSLTGDENDYVRDYARRYSSFPHETTGDQFFSEEQFEAYRALGFHIASRLLKGEDEMQVYGSAALLKINANNAAVTAVREALFGKPPPAAAAPAPQLAP